MLVRNIFSDISNDSLHFEQAFSDDGGKTWETNWISDDTRISAEPANDDAAPAKSPAGGDSSAGHDGQRDFDFELGSWNIHLKRLLHPLTGSKDWVDFDGTSTTRSVWGGRAELEQFHTVDPLSHNEIVGLTLRIYDTAARQWNLYWASKRTGVVTIPTVGEFRGGVGKFYDQEPIDGKAVLVRFVWSKMDSASPHFEQSFSTDGGETWETNWITDQTRMK